MGMLRFTKRSEYGLMALAYLGGQDNAYCSAREIVDTLGLPRRLCAEILKTLSTANLVEAIRGPGGGYRLKREPAGLSLSEVIAVLEGPLRMANCANGGECEKEAACLIAIGVSRVADDIQSVLSSFTLADLIATPPTMAAIPKSPSKEIQV
ncbi:MAG: hypothetical protein CMJ96_06135 [Planctomycetes bacterium]|jgi:Rrf2 family protein|nr:hypothetical protein [Planctomycetota bacterium]|tara:strand:+ start:16979 stop:17434 length:456 start_codon:yes stop_codon:yes gene_type:complete